MFCGNDGCKLELEYPCAWQYKAIGMDKDMLKLSIEIVFKNHQCEITYSNSSKTGKYHSYCIDLQVTSEEERIGLFHALKSDAQVKMVI
jgi:putative lipoic acid-binding regulatory protein